MSRSAGPGQPLTLKCSRCKRTPLGVWDTTNPHRFAVPGNRGDLRRTGRTRPYRRRGAPMRTGTTAYECTCLVCGHTGWYAHRDAANRPMQEACQ